MYGDLGGWDGLWEPLRTANLNHQTFCCSSLYVSSLLAVLLCSLFFCEGVILSVFNNMNVN